MLSLVTEARAQLEDVLGEVTREILERLLLASAEERAGARWRFRPTECLKGDAGAGARLGRLVMAGVSTRKYAEVIAPMAQSVGIQRSSVSRKLVAAAEAAMAKLAERRFDAIDILALYMDGIRIAGQMIVVAVGLDSVGTKHLLGIKPGDIENAAVVKSLLTELVERGIGQDKRRLFVIDGAKALKSAIQSVYGDAASIQRCRNHKVRNVLEAIADKTVRAQTGAVMRAAFKLPAKEGKRKLQTHAAWLKAEHADAAGSLLEGLDEMFTVNDLGLTPALARCLATTNIVENPNGTLRVITRRVSRWRDRGMIERWAAFAYTEVERRFARSKGIATSGSSGRPSDAPSNRLIGEPKPLSLSTPPPQNLQLRTGHRPRRSRPLNERQPTLLTCT